MTRGTAGCADARPAPWAVASSVAGPVAVIGCWFVAAAVQPAGYDPLHDTISALARHGAAHREIMTAGLAVLGLAHMITAAGLRPVALVSRFVLAAAGSATLAVSVFAQPDRGSSGAHIAFAAIGFVLLALWPASTVVGWRSYQPRPVVLRAATGWAMTTVSSALLVWFALTPSGDPIGLAERLLVAQQALWPLVVVVFLRRWPPRSAREPAARYSTRV